MTDRMTEIREYPEREEEERFIKSFCDDMEGRDEDDRSCSYYWLVQNVDHIGSLEPEKDLQDALLRAETERKRVYVAAEKEDEGTEFLLVADSGQEVLEICKKAQEYGQENAEDKDEDDEDLF